MSNDYLLGNPFNIASYALLVYMLCSITNLKPGELIYSGGDVHLYSNHLEQAHEQLKREPYELPTIELEKVSSINDFTMNSFQLVNYQHHEAIKAKMAV